MRVGSSAGAASAPDSEFIWVSERWRLHAFPKPTGLPVVLLLEPRLHVGEPGDLPDELAAELGILIARIERAIRSIGEIGRVHVCRWGDGGEHLHWWFMARPARLPQLIGSFAAIWDDILPPTPDDVWRANLDAVVAALEKDDARRPAEACRRPAPATRAGARLQPVVRASTRRSRASRAPSSASLSSSSITS